MKCFCHNDLDGRCAGAIVSQYTNDYNKDDFYEVDYINPLPLDKVCQNETIYLVDYSFKKDTVWQLLKILSLTEDVIWIDHHTSSINLEKDSSAVINFSKIKGVRQEKISGAALTYMYLYDKEYEEIPYYIKLVSDYDCWIYKHDPDTTNFKIGIDTFDYNALDDIWNRLKVDKIGNTNWVTKSIVEKGKVIKSYIDKENERYRNAWAYETKIEELKCLVVNYKTNSWIFGNKYNEYPVVMVWAFNGEKYSYSIYSSNKDVDCSKIAEKYGGGGHKGAAGFTSDTLLFQKIDK